MQPVFIFSLQSDSLVSPNNAHNFLQNGTTNSNVIGELFDNSNYKVCLGNDVPTRVDHLGGEFMSNVFALSFFEGNIGP